MLKSETVQARVTKPTKDTVRKITAALGNKESDFINYCIVFTIANDTTINSICNTNAGSRQEETAA